ncbi:MAG TPA: hypothetical protein VMN38_06390 [Sphingomicrobium sp.]|nr:hypothetical protein [Sphingomicrobium sp.]
MRTASITIVLLLAACGDDRPPAPTAEQSDQLNEAEELLDREAEAQENAQ